MSAVVVKGMEMPKSCRKCLMRDPISDYCELLLRYLDREELNGRDGDCPLVELPEKHGRLIDADAMCNDLATVDPRYKTMIDWCIRVTEAQPTIVEAEGEDGKE